MINVCYTVKRSDIYISVSASLYKLRTVADWCFEIVLEPDYVNKQKIKAENSEVTYAHLQNWLGLERLTGSHTNLSILILLWPTRNPVKTSMNISNLEETDIPLVLQQSKKQIISHRALCLNCNKTASRNAFYLNKFWGNGRWIN